MESRNTLSFNTLPRYIGSTFRNFYPGEKHITRITNEDVLLLVFSGILRFSENGIPIEVSAREYYIQKANLFQEGIVESSIPKYYFIHFHGAYVSDDSGLPIRGNFSFEDTKDFLYQLEKIRISKTSNELEKTLLFYKVLQTLAAKKDNGEKTLAQTIESIISQTYTEPFSLSSLEKQLNYSEDYIIRAFKSAYQLTPHQYVTELRMNQARLLLKSTNRTVLQIAQECGYNDPSTFYRAFSDQHGISPKEWKNKMLSLNNRSDK